MLAVTPRRPAAGLVQCLWKYDMKIFRENVFRFPSAYMLCYCVYLGIIHRIDFSDIEIL